MAGPVRMNLFEQQIMLERVTRRVMREKWARPLAEADADERRMRASDQDAVSAAAADKQALAADPRLWK